MVQKIVRDEPDRFNLSTHWAFSTVADDPTENVSFVLSVEQCGQTKNFSPLSISEWQHLGLQDCILCGIRWDYGDLKWDRKIKGTNENLCNIFDIHLRRFTVKWGEFPGLGLHADWNVPRLRIAEYVSKLMVIRCSNRRHVDVVWMCYGFVG